MLKGEEHEISLKILSQAEYETEGSHVYKVQRSNHCDTSLFNLLELKFSLDIIWYIVNM